MFYAISKWVIAKANTITATVSGGGFSIGYANMKGYLLQISWGQWGIDVLREVIKVGFVGAVGAFSGLMVKYLVEKYIIKKESK